MAKTLVQQSQISGSLVLDDALAAGQSTLAPANRTLDQDLNALRSQINRIIGKTNWYDALDGADATGQDLADIYRAMHVDASNNAEFQADLSVLGNVTLGDSNADTITFTAKAGSDLDMSGSYTVKGIQQADTAGEALAWGQDASVSDLIVTAGDFTVDASGNAEAVQLKITGDNANTGALYLVGASGEIAEETSLVFSAGSLDITGALDVSGVVDAGELYVGGPTGLSGTLAVNGVSDFAANVYMAADLFVSGAMEVAQGLTVTGDRLEVTGSFGVSGVSDFGDDVSIAGDVAIAGDVQHRLYIVDTDANGNVIKDEAKLTFDGSLLLVTGSARLSDDLTVEGGDITLSNSVSLASSAANKLVITASDMVEVSADLKVGGNNIKASTGTIAITLSDDDVEVKGNLQVSGDTVKDSDGGTVLSFETVSGVADSVAVAQNLKVTKDLFAVSGSFTGDVTVGGDLYVQGKMTYIETDNLKVKDSIIHLSTGSNSAVSRGIVLHGDDGSSSGDLAFGAKNGGFDFVFAKSVDDTFVDSTNAEIFSDAQLAGVWMSKLSVGAREGALSGSFEAITTGSLLSSAADLLISANGQAPISFIESGEWALFDAQFPGQSLVSAIVAAGGNFKQDAFLPGVTTAGDLIDFDAALGFALRSTALDSAATKKVAMDVYLNGVRLAYGDDYEIESETEISLEMNTMGDDRLLIVVHNAAV